MKSQGIDIEMLGNLHANFVTMYGSFNFTWILGVYKFYVNL